MEDSAEISKVNRTSEKLGVAVLEKSATTTDPEERSEEIGIKELKRGAYGKITLISEPPETQSLKKEGIISNIKTLFKGGRREPAINTERFALAKLASGVLYSGQVSETDIRNLPTGSSDVDRLKLANVLAALNKFYTQRKFDTERVARKTMPYDFGLILSDFIEVLPTNLAARMILAASNPEIARRISLGEGTIGKLEANDTQQAAVEAMVLLPQAKRDELFIEMSRLQPGRGGGAYRFFAFIASNWSNRFSDHSGQKLIELNLPPEQAEIKVKEMAADLLRLGAFLRGEQSS